ncbi:MAG: RraA family protein [Planctomycetota bacterium]|nr:MAG: RraA family protein [Planctomycetota bacterium]
MKVSSMAKKLRSAELNPGPGFRIRLDFERLSVSLMQELSQFAVPDISDLLNRLYAVDPEIRCLSGRYRLCGPACTVKVFPGDNLMVHKALDIAKPGDIIVVDGSGSRTNALIGDIICTKARHRGIQGFVIDGLIRDLPAIEELGYPVFARGTTAIGPLHRGPGEINFPIACGGTVVNPGDVIIADDAGMVAVPRDIVSTIADILTSQKDTNRAYLSAVRRGEFSNEWVDNLLAQHDCLIVDAAPEELSATIPSDDVLVAG